MSIITTLLSGVSAGCSTYLGYLKVAIIALMLGAISSLYYLWVTTEESYDNLYGKHAALVVQYEAALATIAASERTATTNATFYSTTIADTQSNNEDLIRRLGILNGIYGSCKATLTTALNTISAISTGGTPSNQDMTDEERVYIKNYLATLVPARTAELLMAVQARQLESNSGQDSAADTAAAEAATNRLGRLTTRGLIVYTLRLENVVENTTAMLENYMIWREENFPSE